MTFLRKTALKTMFCKKEFLFLRETLIFLKIVNVSLSGLPIKSQIRFFQEKIPIELRYAIFRHNFFLGPFGTELRYLHKNNLHDG